MVSEPYLLCSVGRVCECSHIRNDHLRLSIESVNQVLAEESVDHRRHLNVFSHYYPVKNVKLIVSRYIISDVKMIVSKRTNISDIVECFVGSAQSGTGHSSSRNATDSTPELINRSAEVVNIILQTVHTLVTPKQ